MKEKLGALQTRLKEKLAGLKKIPRKIVIMLLVVLVIMAGAIVYVVTNKPYSVLVTGASGEEMSAVSSYLINQGIQDYKIINNDTIMVPSSMEYQLKAGLMMEGYPQTGFSYSTYYDHVGALSTESEKNKNYLIMTQERMGAIIRCMDNVKEAYVTITPGEDRGYVLDSGNVVEATASVLVTMQNTTKLTKQQADAIRNLVSHSVQGLHIGKVYISDTLGNPYNSGGDYTEGDSSALKLSMEEDWENKIRTEVMNVLIPFFGEENVRVGVNCVVELSQVTEDRRDVFLPEYAEDGSTDGKGIIASERDDYYLGRPDEETAGGIVGSETNSDLPTHVENLANPDGTETVITGSSQTDYVHSTSDKTILTTAATLSDCTVSVSINADQAEGVNLNDIREHVARAAGIRGTVDEKTGREVLEDKISVMSIDFYKEPTILPPSKDGSIPNWVYLAAGAGLLGFLLIFLIVFLIRRALKKKKLKKLAAAQAAAAAAQAQSMPVFEERPERPAPVGADIMNLQSERNMELRQDIREFANTNPEIAAQMVRTWLRGGDEDG